MPKIKGSSSPVPTRASTWEGVGEVKRKRGRKDPVIIQGSRKKHTEEMVLSRFQKKTLSRSSEGFQTA